MDGAKQHFMHSAAQKPEKMAEAPHLLCGTFNVSGNIIVADTMPVSADRAAAHIDRLEDLSVRAVTLTDTADTLPIITALDALWPDDRYFEEGIVLDDKNDFACELPEKLMNFWQRTRGRTAIAKARLAGQNLSEKAYREIYDRGAAETPPDFKPLIDDITQMATLVVPQLGRYVSALQISFLKVGHDFRPHTHDDFKTVGIRNLNDQGTLLSTVMNTAEMSRDNTLQAGKGLLVMRGNTVHSTPDIERRWIYNITKPLSRTH